MKYLFDTDHILIIQKRMGSEYAAIMRKVASNPAALFWLNSVSLMEQMTGANSKMNRTGKEKEYLSGTALATLVLETYKSMPMASSDAGASGVFQTFSPGRLRVGVKDIRIASIALANNMTLLTRNARDFSKIPGLKFEDWTV